jgi:predicted transcriptional regulator of viral defense system
MFTLNKLYLLYMQTTTPPTFDQLYLLIERQKGYFTASQAKKHGYSQQLQSYHVANGNWVRKGRGIFRLKNFPAPLLQDDLYSTFLWSLNRQGTAEGVFSHGTALYLHEVSTYSPPVLDLSVPKSFRRYSKPPYSRVNLIHHNLEDSDCEYIQGLKATKLLKTIVDCLEYQQIDRQYILEGLKTGLDRLLITHSQLKNIKTTATQKDLLKTALKSINYERIDEI